MFVSVVARLQPSDDYYKASGRLNTTCFPNLHIHYPIPSGTG